MQALCCCLFLLALTGCDFFVKNTNNGGGGTVTGDYIYVGNNSNTDVAGFSVSTAGALAVLPNAPYNNGIAALSLAVTPANTFLYVGTAGGVYGYSIAANGSITVLNKGNAMVADVVPAFMQIDSTGNYLIATGISTSTAVQSISIYTINTSTGIVTATNNPIQLYTGSGTTPTVLNPTGMLITPNNAYVYVSLGSLGVQLLTLGANGALSAGSAPTYLPPKSTSSNPVDYGLASDPTSAFLFVAETNTGLRELSIGTNGALNELSGSPYSVGTGPRGVVLDTTGSYVYVANYGSNNISAFTLTAASGKLNAVSGSPFSSGGQLPSAFVNDNQKKYLGVINSGNNGSTGNSDLQLFSFDGTTDGKLNAVSTATTGTDPTQPISIAATH